jgi:hypothetical protein
MPAHRQPQHTEANLASFTGRKLDWLKCLAFDRRLQPQPFDFKVAFVIAQHVNQRTGSAMLSDDTIAYEAGGGSERNALRARKRLRDAGWLTWHRTRTANVYRLSFDKVERTLDMMTAAREARREKHHRWKSAAVSKSADVTPESNPKGPDTTSTSRQV